MSDDFKLEFKKLARKRKHLGADLQKLLQKFKDDALPGKPCRGADGLSFKSMRMSDKSSNKGSSGGFRVTYKYTCTTVLLLRVVPRKDEDFIPPWRLQKLAQQYGCICDQSN